MKQSIRQKWQQAFEQASFYQSKQNTVEYWNQVAKAGDAGLSGDGYINCLFSYLAKKDITIKGKGIYDIGCGTGTFARALAENGAEVIAVDSAGEMIRQAKRQTDKERFSSITFLTQDYMELTKGDKKDIVLAVLNPATYHPDGFEKLIELAEDYVIYFTMDTPIEGAEKEPVYRGVNSIRFAAAYLEEAGIEYDILPYTYEMLDGKGQAHQIPFSYLIAKKGVCGDTK